jgi:hypothetical protein
MTSLGGNALGVAFVSKDGITGEAGAAFPVRVNSLYIQACRGAIDANPPIEVEL